MRYISLTPEERKEMLDVLGLKDEAELFQSIPASLRLSRPLQLPPAMAESEVLNYFESLGRTNTSVDGRACFLGAGAYHHFVPTVIDSIISRSEFYTAYTPYQPEISQGTLQSIFEYQTMICQLTGLDVANASLYDGSSATAEAALMAARVTRKKCILVSRGLHPEYRRVLNTYVQNLDVEIVELDQTPEGRVDPASLQARLGEHCASVIVQSPNFFGVIEDIGALAGPVKAAGGVMVVAVTEALSLGLLKPPGEAGADIVAGEGQSFGIPLSFGGPYLGLFACRDEYKRQMPGRVVGETVDSQGRRGFVLTLATREQHIRREKATSNICTNQGLCALMCAIFLATMGRKGLRELAEQNLRKAHYLRSLLADYLVFPGPFFNEFTLRCPREPERINEQLAEHGIIGGLPLGSYFPDRSDQMVVCVTEQIDRAQMQQFARIFKG
ncbi:MAG TPA: aminomethyl-transferring glycine dehydrogenase subunit GcvPA [Acidobacteriota bacterium]|nr:aminomethyl-transferring glycine dehydrogenase subunit GcvPA [Acidobacteriota bacterium]